MEADGFLKVHYEAQIKPRGEKTWFPLRKSGKPRRFRTISGAENALDKAMTTVADCRVIEHTWSVVSG